ncbi:MAG: type II CAAX prenyl endopeptidase Rce1 family protein [Candidatus Glassbacteria bacterium]
MVTISSESQRRDSLGLGETVFFFIVIIPFVLLGGTLLQSWRIKEGTLLTEWGLILLPTISYLKLRRKCVTRILRMKMPERNQLFASVLLAISAVPIIAEFSVIQDSIVPIPQELIDIMQKAFTIQEGESMVLAFFAFSITPSICEEILFRGFLLQGLLEKFSIWSSIVITGICFGFFHVNIYRFIPTAIIGVILAYVVVSSSSLITGIIYHAVNNAIALTVLNVQYLRRYPWLIEESHIPIPILLISCVVFAYGINLVKINTEGRSKPPKTGRFS